jgi:tetratricopeptide (TPR) repeat protein
MRTETGMRTRVIAAIALLFLPPNIARAQRSPQRDLAMPSYRTGLEYMRSESWDKAAEAFRKAIDTDPTFDMAFYALGKTNMSRRRYAEAVKALEKCRDLYQGRVGRQFANQLDAQRYRNDRLLELDELIREYRQRQQSIQGAETLRQLEERRRRLQDNLERGNNISIDASVPSFVSIALGSAYFRSGRLAEAEKEYKATIEADSRVGEAHSNLAALYLQTGRIEEAERAVKAAEKTGFRVNPVLKEDIAARKKAGSN